MTVIAQPKKSVARTHKPVKKSATAAPALVPSVLSTGRDLLVPLDRLTVSKTNVRKLHHEEGLIELAALIESQGLLQRLSVVADGEDRFAVVAGGRRLRAMQMLASGGRWPTDQPIECKLYDAAQALEVSLAENSGREIMHPADQMKAFRALIDTGLTAGQVAARFGVSVLTVERRLKLARLAPRFLDLYRADEIEADQLQALALIDSQAAQEAVWDGLGIYDRSARRIRQAVTNEACSADSRLARFVGLDAYEAEGATVRRDLFASTEDLGGIYLDNAELLQTLAMDKLRGLAAAVQQEGWAWVECTLKNDTSAWRSCGRERQQERDATLEESTLIDHLAAEQRVHADNYDKHRDEGDPQAEDFDRVEQQLCEVLDSAEEKLMAARAGLRQWTSGQMGRSGVVIRLDHHGEVVCEHGLVQPVDRKAPTIEGSSCDADDESMLRDEIVCARPEFSEKLMRNLTAHRTAAIQAALVQNPHIALVTLVHRMAETVFDLYGAGDDVVKISLRQTGDSTLTEFASEYAKSPAAVILGSAESEWGDRLPGTPQALFRWLLVQPQTTLLELLAYCTARSVNAVIGRPRDANHSDALVEALGVDMADWWMPTVGRYFAHVSRAKAREAVEQVLAHGAPLSMDKMKKSEWTAYCAQLFQEVRWLPGPLKATPAAAGLIGDD